MPGEFSHTLHVFIAVSALRREPVSGACIEVKTMQIFFVLLHGSKKSKMTHVV